MLRKGIPATILHMLYLLGPCWASRVALLPYIFKRIPLYPLKEYHSLSQGGVYTTDLQSDLELGTVDFNKVERPTKPIT